MATISEVARELPIAAEVDVLVVGGGSAGAVAAIAAARTGARTLVVEREGFLGGLVTGGPVGLHTFFNAYHDADGRPSPHASDKKQVVKGIPQEIVDRLQATGGGIGHVELELSKRSISVLTPVDPEAYKWLMAEMALEAGGEMRLYTYVSDVIMHDGRPAGVIVESKSGREAILAKVIVDCSGDADVASRAGAPFKLYEQSGVSLNMRMVGVNIGAFAEFMESKGLVRMLGRAVKIGGAGPSIVRLGCDMEPWHDEIERYGGHFHRVVIGSLHEDDLTYMNCTGVSANGLDVRDLTKASVELYRQIHGCGAFFHDRIPGFERAYVVATGPILGVRKTRIIESLFDIPREYALAGQGAPDEIGRFGWMDRPFLTDGSEYEIKAGGSFGIPYRSLIPHQVEGVLMAGRCITTDPMVFNGTRQVACCMLTGHAAGTAAALAVREGVLPSKLDAQLLRQVLLSQGAYLE